MVNPIFDEARERLEKLDQAQPEHIVNGVADAYLAIWQDRREELGVDTEGSIDACPINLLPPNLRGQVLVAAEAPPNPLAPARFDFV